VSSAVGTIGTAVGTALLGRGSSSKESKLNDLTTPSKPKDYATAACPPSPAVSSVDADTIESCKLKHLILILFLSILIINYAR
jgi:hypothetical protein